MQVDVRHRPVAQLGEVGDRRHRGQLQASAAPQRAQHHRGAGVGRDDDVGCVLVDQAHQAAPSEHVGERVREPAGGTEADRQPVLEVEHPRRPLEDLARVLLEHRAEDPPHRLDAVGDLHARAGGLGFEPGGELAGGQVVALADVGREDQDARRAAAGGGVRRRGLGEGVRHARADASRAYSA
jgi:hypothetical protein